MITDKQLTPAWWNLALCASVCHREILIIFAVGCVERRPYANRRIRIGVQNRFSFNLFLVLMLFTKRRENKHIDYNFPERMKSQHRSGR